MAREDYHVEVVTGSREFDKRMKIKLKDTSTMLAIDELSQVDTLTINVVDYAVLHVHNEKAEGNKDYTLLAVIDEEGVIYSTSSEGFMNNFVDLYGDFVDEADPVMPIQVVRKPSKNYKGKEYIVPRLI